MAEAFPEKLSLVLKALSMSRAQLAAELGVHKSVVGRWVSGAVAPSAHNLSRLSALIARQLPDFATLDWEWDLESFAARLRNQKATTGRAAGARGGLPLPLIGQIIARTAIGGGAYEGFYRSTRPYGSKPGRYIHDHCMVRKDETGLLRLTMATLGVFVDGWVLPLHDQLFIVGSEMSSAAMVFAILHGVDGPKAETLDGLTLSPNLDADRTLTASAIVLERIGDLTGDVAADDARFAQMAGWQSEADADSIPKALRAHLARDIGPAQFACGGDWLLRVPRSRSLSKDVSTT